MTKDQFDREKNYGIAMSIARRMLSEGLINDRDYRKMDTIFKAKFRPVIGALSTQTP